MARTPMTIPRGKVVRELRQDKGWSQTQLARRMGPTRTRQAVSLIEASRPVSKAIMREAAKALRVQFEHITLPGEDEQEADAA